MVCIFKSCDTCLLKGLWELMNFLTPAGFPKDVQCSDKSLSGFWPVKVEVGILSPGTLIFRSTVTNQQDDGEEW